MIFHSTKCDICGQVKGEANHWYHAARLPGPRFVIVAWGLPLRDRMAKWEDLCGLGCVTKAMQRALSGEAGDQR